MKKTVFIVLSLLVVATCLTAAIVEYNRHKVTVAAEQTSQVQLLQKRIALHDAVNTRDVADLQSKLTAANSQFTANQKALCGFILVHTPKGVVVPSECLTQ